ncbi:MAG: hypothetical protein KatS3mg050_0949 [Litorilinea sp.]|nr:MAG: hypothetical protein KatS3mg050_0949 [Litorilinea sp.]
MKVKVRIYPYFWSQYYAFYIEGLRRVFGQHNIHFSVAGFPQKMEFDDGFAFEVNGVHFNRRVFISANDHARLDSRALRWCDCYGIVNYAPEAGWEEDFPKVVPIGPSFGIRSWGWRSTLYHALRWQAFTRCRSPHSCLKFILDYRNQLLNRLPETAYVPGRSEANYVFYVSWPWKKHPEVNPPRERFIRACKSIPGLRFEGGFAPRRRKDVPGIEDITAPKRYPLREYIQKVKRSAVVFNCPAVHHCLGWKLGEFLALGKAIVSIPLKRKMPAPLVHGTHIHYVEDSIEAIRDAIQTIIHDEEYRRHLEINARRYYLEHLAPEKVIGKLCGVNS